MSSERVPPLVAEFRKKYRATMPGFYSGYAHAAATVAFTLGCAAWALLQLHKPTLVQWMTVPAVLVFGNFFEYFLHRWPLHRPWPLMRKVFDIHTGNHHHYYTHQAMRFYDHRDVYMVLFPWWAPMLVVIALPVVATGLLQLFTALTGVEVSSNVTYLMIATGAVNFLLYEFMHFSFHLPVNPWTERIPGMAWLRHHHALHHDPRLMSSKNFNVVFPMSDWLFKTKVGSLRGGGRPCRI